VINALIAQGIRPVGADVPNLVQGMENMRQGRVRNALSERGMVIDERNSLNYQNSLTQQQQAREQQQQQAALEAEMKDGRQWFENAVATVRQKPEMLPEFWRATKEKVIAGNPLLPPDFDENSGMDVFEKIALRNGIAPPVVEKPQEFTLTPGAKRFRGNQEIASVAPNAPRSMSMRSDGKGGFEFYDGPQGGQPLTRPNESEVQAGAINAQYGLDRLAGIRAGFDPRWLTYKGQFGQFANEIRSKAQGLPFVPKLSDEARSDLSAFSRFKGDTLDNTNRYIKEITGAAMGIQEAKRIMASMPNMDDSPESFQAKMESVEDRLKLIIARAVYTQKRGVSYDTMTADEMRSLMNKRGNEIYKANLEQTRDPAAAQAATVQALEAEFFR
jgi:hypothetical protein